MGKVKIDWRKVRKVLILLVLCALWYFIIGHVETMAKIGFSSLQTTYSQIKIIEFVEHMATVGRTFIGVYAIQKIIRGL